jgi:hypothetical protein
MSGKSPSTGALVGKITEAAPDSYCHDGLLAEKSMLAAPNNQRLSTGNRFEYYFMISLYTSG